jgi:hypothetical protein
MKEYDCWFQKQMVFPPESPCPNAGSLSRFFSKGEGIIFNNAISEYRFILKKYWGLDVEMIDELSAAGVAAGISSGLTQVMPGNAKLPPEILPTPFLSRRKEAGVKKRGDPRYQAKFRSN